MSLVYLSTTYLLLGTMNSSFDYKMMKRLPITMAYTATTYEHIVLSSNGIPYINGTSMKVVELVQSKIAYGWSPEELHFQYPHLRLGQIHSALAYYWDNKERFDADIELRLREVDKIKGETQPTSLEVRLRSEGRI